MTKKKKRPAPDKTRDKAFQLVLGFFKGDRFQTMSWFHLPNPEFGWKSPNELFETGFGSRVLGAIKAALAANKRTQEKQVDG